MLRSQRLTLRKPTIDHYSYYHNMLSDSEVAKFINRDGRPYGIVESWRNFCREVGEWELQKMGLYSVFLTGSEEYVGKVGIRYPAGWPSYEIHWVIKRSSWGQGFAFEASETCIKTFKNTMEEDKLIALINEENLKSIKLATRLGFSDSGDTFFFRHKLKVFVLDKS